MAAAGGGDGAAGDGDGAAVSVPVAADARAAGAAGGFDGAAVDGDIVARYARAAGAAGGFDIAAVDGGCAADARAAFIGVCAGAFGGDHAAVDGKLACDGTGSRADASVRCLKPGGIGNQLAGYSAFSIQCAVPIQNGIRLPVDGQAGVRRSLVEDHYAVVDGEAAVIGQDQMDMAFDFDAAVDVHFALRHIPCGSAIGSPRGVTARHLGGVGTVCLFQLFCAAVPVIIGYIRRRQRRGRQQR